MLREKYDELKDMIQRVHSSVNVSEKTQDSNVILTLEYYPHYFNHQRPFEEFLLWVEGLWRKGLADYHNFKREEIKSASRC